MADFKVRCYHEDSQGNVIGAEVLIYDGDDVVDDIILVDKTKFDELSSQLNTLDSTYVQVTEVLSYLKNTDENTEINATSLNGFPSDKFLKKDDINAYQFTPGPHASSSPIYGAGTTQEYGHVKIIDNCNRENYRDGEVLSARQGYELNQRLLIQEEDNAVVQRSLHSKFNLAKRNGVVQLIIDDWDVASFVGSRHNEWVSDDRFILPDEFKPVTPISGGVSHIYCPNIWDFHSRIRVNFNTGKIEAWWDGAGNTNKFYGAVTWITEK